MALSSLPIQQPLLEPARGRACAIEFTFNATEENT
jgi:hypothetical protein